jgi:hypothetical protein
LDIFFWTDLWLKGISLCVRFRRLFGGQDVFIKVGGRRGGVGVAETLVGVGREDVGGVSGFTSQFSSVGSLFRYVAVAARPS